MTELKHTPTPWNFETETSFGTTYFNKVTGPDGSQIRTKGFVSTTADIGEANAAFIVKACNSHAALVEALTDLLVANDAVQNALCNGPDVPGFDRTELPRAQKHQADVERTVSVLLAKVQS